MYNLSYAAWRTLEGTNIKYYSIIQAVIPGNSKNLGSGSIIS